jgi:predicted ferric reductase
MLGIVLLGVLAWLYREFIYPRIAYNHPYTIKNVTTLEGVTIVTMIAGKKPIQLEPGQFAFFKTDASNTRLKNESHPFTVLTSTKNEIMIAVKKLGDYSEKIKDLKVGDMLYVAGAHGSFGKEILESKKPEIWVAGGIGITPFFNLITYFSAHKQTRDISLFYVTTEQDRLFHPLLLGYTETVGFEYSYHCSATTHQRLSPDTVINTLKEEPSAYNYFLCGPRGLLLSFITALEGVGVPRSQIFTEDFDFKSQEV